MVIGRNRPDPTKKTQQFGAAAASYSPRRSRRSNCTTVPIKFDASAGENLNPFGIAIAAASCDRNQTLLPGSL